MSLTPEQYNKLLTKEDLNNFITKADINEFKNTIIGHLKTIAAVTNKKTKICR